MRWNLSRTSTQVYMCGFGKMSALVSLVMFLLLYAECNNEAEQLRTEGRKRIYIQEGITLNSTCLDGQKPSHIEKKEQLLDKLGLTVYAFKYWGSQDDFFSFEASPHQ